MREALVILASASPRRVELLHLFGFSFEVVPSQAEELHDESLSVRELCTTNALRKAVDVAKRFENRIVLGADTLVALESTIFGKPRDLGQATEMLQRLSGRTHQVVTAVALLHRSTHRQEVFAVETQVRFNPLTREQINAYVRAVPVLDKAGAYAIQERGADLVERLEGSYSNVIGLPVERLAEVLCRWNVVTPRERDKIVADQGSQGLQK